MIYTRKKDILELSLFITIILFLIITAVIQSNANSLEADQNFTQKIQTNSTQFLTNQINNQQNISDDILHNNINKNEVSISNAIVQSNTTALEHKLSNNINIIDEKNPWRIEIPKIGLNAPIKDGVTQQIMLEAVGHFTNTPKNIGNIGLAAHNRGYNCNFFERIKELNRGDKIIYKTSEETKTYKVETNVVIKQTNWDYLKETSDNRLTLITCEKNKKEYRRCIQALEER